MNLSAVNWSKKSIRRRTTGTGRMRYLKTLPRRFRNGFREGTFPFFKTILTRTPRYLLHLPSHISENLLTLFLQAPGHSLSLPISSEIPRCARVICLALLPAIVTSHICSHPIANAYAVVVYT